MMAAAMSKQFLDSMIVPLPVDELQSDFRDRLAEGKCVHAPVRTLCCMQLTGPGEQKYQPKDNDLRWKSSSRATVAPALDAPNDWVETRTSNP